MATDPGLRHLRVERRGGIAVVWLPAEAMIDTDPYDSLFSELHDVFIPLGRDHDVEAVVITGHGTELMVNRQRPETNRLITGASLEVRAARMLLALEIAHQITRFRKPLVAAVNGSSAEHFLYADAIVASAAATFGDDHHVQDGVASGDGNTSMWPLLVGVSLARQVLLHGRRFTAEEALQLGFVDEVVEPGRVLEAGLAWARRLADLPRLPYQATKLAFNNWWRLSSLIAADLASGYQAAGMGESEWAREKTDPRWRGHQD